MRFVSLGVGAAQSPGFAPAGLLVSFRGAHVMIDGGPGAEPRRRVDAWLVTDQRAELISVLRRLAAAHGAVPEVRSLAHHGLELEPMPVVHTNHPAYGYRICAGDRTAVWAPEFLEFPAWAANADLMFAEAAGWNRPIKFRGGVGGHLDVLTVAAKARRQNIRRLVFAHIGRPTIRAIDRGERPPFGEFARDGQVFWLRELLRSERGVPDAGRAVRG
jgi:hypothetical protein